MRYLPSSVLRVIQVERDGHPETDIRAAVTVLAYRLGWAGVAVERAHDVLRSIEVLHNAQGLSLRFTAHGESHVVPVELVG